MVPLGLRASWTTPLRQGFACDVPTRWLGRGHLLEGRTAASSGGTRGRSDSAGIASSSGRDADSSSIGPYRPLSRFPTTTPPRAEPVLPKYTPHRHRKPNNANQPSSGLKVRISFSPAVLSIDKAAALCLG